MTKVSYFVQYRSDDPSSISLNKLELITMPNGQPSIETQVAFVNTTAADPSTRRMIWGQQVTDALKAYSFPQSKIGPSVLVVRPEDVIQGFKNALFDSARYSVSDLDAITASYLKEKHPTSEEQPPLDCSEEALNLDRTEVLLLVKYIRELYKYGKEQIELHHSIAINDSIKIRVGFPLPVKTTLAQSYLFMAAAKMAGISHS